MRKSRLDFDQQPFYKRSHDAMYVEVDGKQTRLNKGDKLTEEGRAKLNKLRADKGKEKPAPESVDDPTVAELVDDFLTWVQGQVKKEKLAERTIRGHAVCPAIGIAGTCRCTST